MATLCGFNTSMECSGVLRPQLVVVIALLALWSLAAWGLHAIAVWAVSNVGTLAGTGPALGEIALPSWLAPWVPPEAVQWASELLAAFGPWVQGLLQAAPALAGGVTVLSWAAWGIGSLLLILLGVGLHALIALLRRLGGRSGSGSGSGGGSGNGPGVGRTLAAG